MHCQAFGLRLRCARWHTSLLKRDWFQWVTTNGLTLQDPWDPPCVVPAHWAQVQQVFSCPVRGCIEGCRERMGCIINNYLLFKRKGKIINTTSATLKQKIWKTIEQFLGIVGTYNLIFYILLSRCLFLLDFWSFLDKVRFWRTVW